MVGPYHDPYLVDDPLVLSKKKRHPSPCSPAACLVPSPSPLAQLPHHRHPHHFSGYQQPPRHPHPLPGSPPHRRLRRPPARLRPLHPSFRRFPPVSELCSCSQHCSTSGSIRHRQQAQWRPPQHRRRCPRPRPASRRATRAQQRAEAQSEWLGGTGWALYLCPSRAALSRFFQTTASFLVPFPSQYSVRRALWDY